MSCRFLAEAPFFCEVTNQIAANHEGRRPAWLGSLRVRVLQQLAYRALLAVGLFDQDRGYLMEIYFDTDPTELVAVAPLARVLAHYCVRTVTARPVSTRSG